ncbi:MULTISPECIES: VanW family protein [unclassified Clostridium]|uniref:VanW family protein n=1 Tax=unclassified Clostridium TaxID=2614128 RepID=UPI0002977557|nr:MULTISPECIES: VanW family protein [unclassified Clostridium]EKQ58148.1 MAG: putative vancomycin resistance protein [Clostridium sp. Maddingley MBC34-26]
MEKRTVRKRQASKKAPNKQKKLIFGFAALVVIGAVVLAAYSLSINKVVKSWEDKIYPGVTVQGVDLGGMTKEEAKNKLAESFNSAIENKKLSIVIGNKTYELIYSNINPQYDINGTVEHAYDFGKENGLLKKYMNIKSDGSKKNDIPLGFSYNEEKLKAYEEKIKSDATQSAANATITIKGNNFSITPEIEGQTVNLETLDKQLKESINGALNSEDKVEIEVETTKPKITKEDLSKIKGLMGTFSTNYSTSAPGRCNNIEIATSVVNGTIVMPGEVFSFNDVVGPRTVERGYQEAGTYVGNKVEPGIGGGICQVSTTLYRAAMKANLRSLERTNHSMAVGYAQPGLDATVSYGYLDYKFKNTYDFPIYIQGITAGKVLSYNIYGDPSALNGRTYDMVSEIIETIPPETKVVPDSSLPVGKEEKDGTGVTGYKARSYQITYEKGVEINRELISNDTYASVGIVIRKGTQEVNASQSTQSSPATPQLPPPVAQPAR